MQSSEVITENQSSDLLDPLADYSTLSLFKQSLNLSSSSSSTSNSSIFDSLHTNLKHRVLSSPDKLLKQTTTILEGSLDVSKTDKTKHVFTENEKVPRERRPDLGIGRAKFTLKPLPSQPAVNLEPSIDFDKLTDPDEYFDAFERMQKAKKEVRRLNGEPLLDLDLNNASFAPRPRRPSLLGKKAIYTHRTHPTVSTAAVDETLLPSQETINNDLRGPTCSDVVPDATIVNKSSSMRVSGSKAATNSNVTELDELLSLNYEGLDEDGVQNLIRDKLQIKSVDIGKALLPDWRFPLRESFSSRVSLPKMDETGFCLRSVNKTASSKDKKSPTKSTGLLASLSKLNRHIKEATPSTDLFSPRRINLSPKETTSPSRESEKRVDQVGLSDEVDAMKSLCKERKSSAHGEHTPILVEAPIVSVEMDINQTNEPKEKEVVGKSDQIGAMTGSCELGRSPEPGEVTAVSGQGSFDSVVKDVDLTIEPKEKEIVVGKSDQIDTRTGLCESGKSPVHEEERILVPDVGLTEEPENQESEVAAAQESVRQKLIFEENLSFNGVEKGGTSEPLSTENNPGEELTKKSLGSFKRKYKEKGKPKAPSEAAVSEKVQATTSQPDVSVPIETGIKRRKVDGAQPRPGKNDGRFSLNYAGTKWEDGIRRSTRIRMRPLEYWNGERFLYGRVHNSLVTVIGVKYASPSKETEVKVQSFVSDEYKHLVERASLY